MSNVRAKAFLAARINHDVNASIKKFYGQEHQIKVFDKLTEEEKQSITNTVETIFEKDNITPEGIHDIWMETKLSQGWRHGEILDHNAKTHPSIKPYMELDDTEKLKDVIFLAICNSLKQ